VEAPLLRFVPTILLKKQLFRGIASAIYTKYTTCFYRLSCLPVTFGCPNSLFGTALSPRKTLVRRLAEQCNGVARAYVLTLAG